MTYLNLLLRNLAYILLITKVYIRDITHPTGLSEPTCFPLTVKTMVNCDFVSATNWISLASLYDLPGLIFFFTTNHPFVIIFLLAAAVVWHYLNSPVNIIRDFSHYGYDHLLNNNLAKGQNLKALAEQEIRERYRGEQPPVYPNGWIPLLESRLLRKGESRSLRAIGQEFVLFRDSHGKSHVMDAYCPHLGANLGVGGRVIGDCIECPFHGWLFRGETGACTKIPYAEKVPDFARLKKWTSTETIGFIFVWFHAEGDDPSWYLPEIEHINNGSWTFKGRTQHIVNCHIQDLQENGADLAHFNQIHAPGVFAGVDLLHMHSSKYTFMKHCFQSAWKAEDAPEQKHIASLLLKHSVLIFGKCLPFTVVEFSIKQIGPAFNCMRIKTFFGEGILAHCITPEAPLRQRVVLSFFAGRSLPQIVCNLFLKAEDRMFGRDMIVWNSKRYQKTPLLLKEEKTLAQHRRWYSQFYSKSSPTVESEARKLNGVKYDW